MSDFAKYSMTRSITRSICDSCLRDIGSVRTVETKQIKAAFQAQAAACLPIQANIGVTLKYGLGVVQGH